MTDSQSVKTVLVSGTRDQIFFLIFFRQLQVCYFVAPSLTGGRVCNLQLLLVSPAQSCSGLSPAGARPYYIVPILETPPQPGGPGPRNYFPQEQGVPVIPPGTGFSVRGLISDDK
jgi:hypothetical protein